MCIWNLSIVNHILIVVNLSIVKLNKILVTPEELARKYIAAINYKDLKDMEILLHPKFKYGKFTAVSEESFKEILDYDFTQGRQKALDNLFATHEAFTDFNLEILGLTTNVQEIPSLSFSLLQLQLLSFQYILSAKIQSQNY